MSMDDMSDEEMADALRGLAELERGERCYAFEEIFGETAEEAVAREESENE